MTRLILIRIETPREFIAALVAIAVLGPIIFWLYGKDEQ